MVFDSGGDQPSFFGDFLDVLTLQKKLVADLLGLLFDSGLRWCLLSLNIVLTAIVTNDGDELLAVFFRRVHANTLDA